MSNQSMVPFQRSSLISPIRAFVAGSAASEVTTGRPYFAVHPPFTSPDFAAVLGSAIPLGEPTKIVVVADGHWVGSTWHFDPGYGLGEVYPPVFLAKYGCTLVFIAPPQAMAFAVANDIGLEHLKVVWGGADLHESARVIDFGGHPLTSTPFVHGMGGLFSIHPKPLSERFSSDMIGPELAAYLMRWHGHAALSASRMLAPAGIEAVMSAANGSGLDAVLCLYPRLVSFVLASQLHRRTGLLIVDGLDKESVLAALEAGKSGQLARAWEPSQIRAQAGIGVVVDRNRLTVEGARHYAQTI